MVYNRHHIDKILSSSKVKKEEGTLFIANFLEGKKIWKIAVIEGNKRVLEKTIITKNLIEKYLNNEG